MMMRMKMRMIMRIEMMMMKRMMMMMNIPNLFQSTEPWLHTRRDHSLYAVFFGRYMHLTSIVVHV
jgi:hypothetical protein